MGVGGEMDDQTEVNARVRDNKFLNQPTSKSPQTQSNLNSLLDLHRRPWNFVCPVGE